VTTLVEGQGGVPAGNAGPGEVVVTLLA
jgi:hypothetical protein